MRRGEVKRAGYFLRTDDRGASLIAVVVALVFVLTMAAIVTEVTTTNIRMREIEVSEKENFYGADGVMEALRHEMTVIAVQEMEESYNVILTRYGEMLSNYVEEAGNSQELARLLQEEFRRTYMDNLAGYFRTVNTTDEVTYEGNDESKPVIYRKGEYDKDLIKNMFTNPSYASYFQVAGDVPIFTLDYNEGLFTLKNLRIVYSDTGSVGYETWITTDLVFDTPAFQFDDGSTKSFMSYALIADTGIVANTGNVSTVTGSVYAGTGGIVSESGGSPVDFSGDNIVSRGDIVVNGSSVLTFGLDKGGFMGTTHIWARNIRVEEVSTLVDAGINAGINLEMKGEINIEDDLVLNGTNSSVKLTGTYNGYNFRENYSTETSTVTRLGGDPSDDAYFSSAIMINGKDCILDITGLRHLYLAGRAFISRGSNIVAGRNNDILLGESLSVRADQLAYLVNARYLEKENGEVKLSPDKTAEFSNDGKLMFNNATGVDLNDYIENGMVVVPYYYRNQVVSDDPDKNPIVQYYMYFKTGEEANRFFQEYWTKTVKEKSGGDRLAEYEDDYAAAIKLDDSTLLTLSGDLLYRNNEGGANAGFVLDTVDIASSGWKVPADDGFHVYWERSDQLARTYKSLQMDLAGIYTRVNSKDVRFVDAFGNFDHEKKEDPLFDNLINRGKLQSFLDSALAVDSSWGLDKVTVGSSTGVRITGINSKGETWEIVLCDNRSNDTDVYQISGQFNGIVIATGNVNIVNEFNGMVISGETIGLTGSNVKVTGDADLVKEIFDSVRGREYGLQFIEIFREYQLSNTDGVSSAKIGDYLYYENWTKNEEVLPVNGGTEPEDEG